MDHLAIDEETHQALTDYKSTLAQTTDAETAFRLAEAAAAKMIGHQLFTVMAFHADTMEVERCYSSNPDKYPTGGRKQKRNTAWGHHVLEQGKYFIGYNADDIRNNFDDHDVIRSLGLESVLNMPITVNGKTIGTMNLLDKAGYYNEDQIGIARMIADGLAEGLLAR